MLYTIGRKVYDYFRSGHFYKYACVVTDEALRNACDWRARVSIQQTLESTVAGYR